MRSQIISHLMKRQSTAGFVCRVLLKELPYIRDAPGCAGGFSNRLRSRNPIRSFIPGAQLSDSEAGGWRRRGDRDQSQPLEGDKGGFGARSHAQRLLREDKSHACR